MSLDSIALLTAKERHRLIDHGRGANLRQLEQLLARERGNWSVDTLNRLGEGANAVVYRARINGPKALRAKLQKEGLGGNIALRLPDTSTPKEEHKSVTQFDQYSAAWVKLDTAGSSAISNLMAPIFCERGIYPPPTPISGVANAKEMKRGDALFSFEKGKSVWTRWLDGDLDNFDVWKNDLHRLLEEVCAQEVHYRDWHSENTLLQDNDDGSHNIMIIDPGTLIELRRVIWESGETPWRANTNVPVYKSDKYEVGVSIMGIQDLIWVAVKWIGPAFYDEIKEILADSTRQILFPKLLDKGG